MLNFSDPFSQLLSACWWMLPLFALVAIFKSLWLKGFIDKNDYHLIKNVTIPIVDSAHQKMGNPIYLRFERQARW